MLAGNCFDVMGKERQDMSEMHPCSKTEKHKGDADCHKQDKGREKIEGYDIYSLLQY